MMKIYFLMFVCVFIVGCSFNPKIKENKGDSEFVEVVLFEW